MAFSTQLLRGRQGEKAVQSISLLSITAPALFKMETLKKTDTKTSTLEAERERGEKFI